MLNTEEDQSEMNFFYLSKKTRRGRKSNFQLPDCPRCTICLEFDEFSSEPIERCSECQTLFHFSCYSELFPGLNDIKVDNVKNSYLTCERCKYANRLKISIETIKCGICNKTTGILKQQEKNEDLFYHPFCQRFITELKEDSVIPLKKWRFKNSCHYCKEKLSKKRPVIKCLNSKCKEFYHVPCAIEKGMIFNIHFQSEFYNKKNGESIPFYCSCHNKKLVQKYKEHMYEWNRKSSRYTLDSRSDTVDESNQKGIKPIENDTKIKIVFDPKEFKIDFQPKQNDDINNNYHQGYFDANYQRRDFNLDDNDNLMHLINLFHMETMYKQLEEDNDHHFIN